jgi:hypothetical protein
MLLFKSSIVRGLFLYTLSFKKLHRKKSGGERSGDLGGHNPLEMILSPKNLCNISIVERAVWFDAPSC